jgi:hypothetical protein
LLRILIVIEVRPATESIEQLSHSIKLTSIVRSRQVRCAIHRQS